MKQQVDDATASNIKTTEIASGILRAIEEQAKRMERQALVLESQAKTTQQTADAATTSAETAKQALVVTQRAFFTHVYRAKQQRRTALFSIHLASN
jgi:hypothetical protein